MKVTMLAAVCCLTAALTAVSAHAGPRGGGPQCQPKMIKVGGYRAAVFCGPATATLKIGGKTYTFKDGLCQNSKAAGSALELDLGTLLSGGRGNAGKAYFSMLVDHVRTTASVGGADYGGRDLMRGVLPLIDVKGNIPLEGTFTSTNVGSGPTFSGSWNCHGAFWKGP